MPKLIATHEVDDVAHWLSSPKRAEVFSGVATDIQTYVDPTRPNHVGLSMNVADMAAFQAIMESDAGAEAMKYDGVHADTMVLLFEG
jgi:hypothetical protein